MRSGILILCILLAFPAFSEQKTEQVASLEKEQDASTQIKKSAVGKKAIPFNAGSQFEHLRLPRYVEGVLDAYVTMQYAEFVSEDVCYGDVIYAKLFRPEAETHLQTQRAWYNIRKGFLRSVGHTRITEPRYIIVGRSFLADMNRGDYYAGGSCKAVFNRTKAREMKAVKAEINSEISE